ALLLSGASAGALLRRSGRVMHRAATTRRRPRPQPAVEKPDLRLVAEPPVDAVEDYPDVISETGPPPLLTPERDPEQPAPLVDDPPTLFDEISTRDVDYKLPDRELLNRSKPVTTNGEKVSARTADSLVETLAHFGVDATIVGQIAGPRVTRYELQLAPGTKVSKVAALKDDLSYALATTEIRILAPIP